MNEDKLINKLKSQLLNEIEQISNTPVVYNISPIEEISNFSASAWTEWFYELWKNSDTNPSMKISKMDTRFDVLKTTRYSLLEYKKFKSVILFDKVMFSLLNEICNDVSSKSDDIEFIETILHTINHFSIVDKNTFNSNACDHLLFRLLKDRNLIKLKKKYYSLHTVLIDTITYYTWDKDGIRHIKNELISQIKYIDEPNFYAVILRFMFKNVNPNETAFLYGDFLKTLLIIYIKLCYNSRKIENLDNIKDSQNKIFDIVLEFISGENESIIKIKTIYSFVHYFLELYSSSTPESINIDKKIAKLYDSFQKKDKDLLSFHESKEINEIYRLVADYNLGFNNDKISKRDSVLHDRFYEDVA